MGDPHSPGMTIAACGWMEDKWMQSLSPGIKQHFRAARYMDDILCFHTNKIPEMDQFLAERRNTATSAHSSLKMGRRIHSSRPLLASLTMTTLTGLRIPMFPGSHAKYGDMRTTIAMGLQRAKLEFSKQRCKSSGKWLVMQMFSRAVRYRRSMSFGSYSTRQR